MLLLSLILSVLILFSYLYLYFNHYRFLNIQSFITTLILGFIILWIHLITKTLPYDLASVTLIGALLLLFKHRATLVWKSARMFFTRMFGLTLAVSFLALAFLLLSHLSVPILNGLFLWIGWITLSTLFAFVHYLSWSSAFSLVVLPEPIDLIIILGAGLYRNQVTQMLAWRLDRAVVLYQNHHGHPYIVVSGGTGEGDAVSEAEAMRAYLIEHSIPNDRIIIENQSHSTYENLSNTKALISRQSFQHIAINTSQFHVLRGLRFAQILKLNAVGAGSRTPYPFFDTALIRDFFALMYCYKLLLTVYFGALFISSMLIKHPILLEYLLNILLCI
ncbi:YdcF family protein [Staphylococcus simulans]